MSELPFPEQSTGREATCCWGLEGLEGLEGLGSCNSSG